MNPRRLYRCRSDRRLAGVAGGMAEYLDLDPTLVRVLWLVSIFFGGFSILLYIILAFVVPPEPLALPGTGVAPDLASATPAWPAHWHEPRPETRRRRGRAAARRQHAVADHAERPGEERAPTHGRLPRAEAWACPPAPERPPPCSRFT